MKAVVFLDVTDPWSYLGLVRLERAAALYTILSGEIVEMTLRAGPPSSFVAEASEIEKQRAIAAARITGIELDLADAVPADSRDAWRLLTWADESGPGFQRDLLHQLWRAHFLEAADIEDAFVLESRAALVGLPLETAEALLASSEYGEAVDVQIEAARGLNLGELPGVIFDDEWKLFGLHSQDDYLQALHHARQK